MLWNRDDDYVISTEDELLNPDLIWNFLKTSYWAPGVRRDVVVRSLEGSLNFGIYHRRDDQVGFGRVVTDRAVFAWVADVFVLPKHRGKGLGKRLVESMQPHPELQQLRRWMLGTADAHDLYRKFGFQSLAAPERFMEIRTRTAGAPTSDAAS